MNLVIKPHAPFAELTHIVDEVSKHGFYAVKLRAFMPEATSRDEAAYMTCLIAERADLKVSFNFSLGLCVFENNN